MLPTVGAVPSALLAVSVKLAWPPTTKVLADVFVNVRSGVITVSVSVVLALAGVGSVVPTGGVALKVLATLPLVAVTLAVMVKLIEPPLGRFGTTTEPASRLAIDN